MARPIPSNTSRSTPWLVISSANYRKEGSVYKIVLRVPGDLTDLTVHPGQVQTGTALAAVPGDQHAGLERLADHLGHPADLAQQQRELSVGDVIQDRSAVGTEDHPGVSGQHFNDEWDHSCNGEPIVIRGKYKNVIIYRE